MLKPVVTTLLILAINLFTVSCNPAENNSGKESAGQEKNDTLCLTALPTSECFPLIYADKKGLFASEGLSIRVETYFSQEDCDSALSGHSMGGFADARTLTEKRKTSDGLHVLQSLEGDWGIISTSSLRLHALSGLKGKVIGTSSGDISQHVIKESLTKGGLKESDAMYPHVNNLKTRAFMVENNQIDAAPLPEPFLTEARLAGHRQLYRTSGNGLGGCLVIKRNHISQDELKRFIKVYNRAVDSINTKKTNAIKDILEDFTTIPKVQLDSVRIPHYRKIDLK